MAEVNSSTNEVEENILIIQNAQYDMRLAYLDGSCGVLASGFIWLVSSFIAIYLAPNKAVFALLIGGVFIYPLSILLNKSFGASGMHRKDNPLGNLAMEGTISMILCMSLAYMLSLQKVEWFFPGMLLIIGGRYLTFASLYGIRLYWALGICLAVAAYFLFMLNAQSYISTLVGSGIEISFGLVLLVLAKKSKKAGIN